MKGFETHKPPEMIRFRTVSGAFHTMFYELYQVNNKVIKTISLLILHLYCCVKSLI